ncbi:MAG: type II toxin-antitoxin system HipA family toxin [Candidatus Berkiella sp.]
MTFKAKPARKAFVWIWLPEQREPVVVGIIEKDKDKHIFSYGKSYLERNNAIALSPFELPLESRTFEPTGINTIHSCLRDGSPDAWGRRVIGYEFPELAADELDYMLLSGSNRIGALDFQRSSSEYIPRIDRKSTLEDLFSAAKYIEEGIPLPAELGNALLQGSSIGGARPKCLIEDNSFQYIAKFSLTTDLYDIIKAEYIAMRLANLVGIKVPNVQLNSVLGKNVLLIERFDRSLHGLNRHHMLSGLSLLGLNELEARYASYIDLAEIIRTKFANPKDELKELYKRLIFNVLIGNTDDHARNISAFWNGMQLQLTPAYDLCPQLRIGGEATQAMAIEGKQHNNSTLINVLSVSNSFLIDEASARIMVENQLSTISEHWQKLCDEVDLSAIERKKLWQKSILNPFCLYGWK